MTTSAEGRIVFRAMGERGGGIAWMSHGVMIVVIFTLTSQGRVVSPTRVLNNILPRVLLHTGVYMIVRSYNMYIFSH